MQTPSMIYRRLGRSGLRVSVLSLGSWITYHNQVDVGAAVEMLAAAYDSGINFFDNAEAYASGQSESVMGDALRKLAWPRSSYVVSTKFYFGIARGERTINQHNTLNRKYLMHAIDGSLKRFGLEHIDLIYCHRPDPDTPVEETVRAMSDIISQGKALYWGTSEWSADEIRAAWEVAERHHLHKPTMEQPEYNLFHRNRVEHEYARLYEDIGLGLTTWSPLASGLLTGKYVSGVPEESRAAMKGMEFLRSSLLDTSKNEAVARLQPIAKSLDATSAQLAIAWVAHNENVSSVITGASKKAQLQSNLGALAVLEKLSPELVREVADITAALSD